MAVFRDMMLNFPWIDFHTHRVTQSEADMKEIVSVHPGRWREAEFYTLGFHPWWTNERLSAAEVEMLTDHWKNKAGCIAIGECGLDRLKGPEMEIQEDIFAQHIKLSSELQAPLIIHCVRAFDRLIQLKRASASSNCVVHGFVRHKILAKQLLDNGILLSVAPRYSMSLVMEEKLRYVPLDRVFLETDSDYSISIKERYRIFAQLRAMKTEMLQEQLFQNTINFFHKKWPHLIG
ncbi:MAG: TatD family hydrolase [Saprospiraceae bacterium]|nr:TatD family hydrolase [Saprospiraceae bacterium]